MGAAHSLALLNYVLLSALIVLALLHFLSGLDDAFVDGVAGIAGLQPERLSNQDMLEIHAMAEKNMAILIPALSPGEPIDRILLGNLGQLSYRRFHFFVGVPANDGATLEAVREVAARNANVHAIPHFENGPPSKARILNHLI